MIFTTKDKYSGTPKKYQVSDYLCRYKKIHSESPIVGETDTAFIFENVDGEWQYMNKAQCKKVIE